MHGTKTTEWSSDIVVNAAPFPQSSKLFGASFLSTCFLDVNCWQKGVGVGVCGWDKYIYNILGFNKNIVTAEQSKGEWEKLKSILSWIFQKIVSKVSKVWLITNGLMYID